MNEWINTPTAGEYSLLQNWARFPGEKVGGRIAVIEQSQTQKDQKVGYQMGFFPLLGLAEIDIYLPRGFFFPSRNIHPQIKASADLCSTDYQYETQESRSQIPRSLLMAQRVVPGVLPQPPSC